MIRFRIPEIKNVSVILLPFVCVLPMQPVIHGVNFEAIHIYHLLAVLILHFFVP